MKKKIASVLAAAVMAFSAVAPASAATLTTKFSQSGNVYGVTTECTGFSSYVTAHAQVSNGSQATYRNYRGYRSASVTATRTCYSGTVIQSGWYSL